MTDQALDRPVLTAAESVEWRRQRGLLPRTLAPRNAILCYQSASVRFFCAARRAKKVNGLLGELYLVSQADGDIAIARSPGPGAPAAVALLEELVALGARQFISLGLAGTLQPALAAGDLVVPERALRDEGTSSHYILGEKWVRADPELVNGLCHMLESRGHAVRRGCTWTTDAPYRETRREVQAYQQQGVDTVEMETAALFAAGQALGVRIAAGLAVADAVDGVRLPLQFDRARATEGLKNLVNAALQVFSEVE